MITMINYDKCMCEPKIQIQNSEGKINGKELDSASVYIIEGCMLSSGADDKWCIVV